MILTNPPSYLTAAQFRAQPSDYDLTSYSDVQLQDMLNRASGVADSIMRRSYLAREDTIRYYGDGTNKIELHRNPLLYVKRVQIVVPGTTGALIPTDQILVDYRSGGIMEYTPLLFQGQGYFARFPANTPVDVTLGSGYGTYTTSPKFTAADGAATGLAPGTYNVALTTKTMYGETAGVVSQYTTATGSILFTVSQALGAYLYRAYISKAANNTTLNGATIAGATSFVLASVGTIAVNDILLFDIGANAELLTVASVNAGTKTITTTTGALYGHNNTVAVIPAPVLSGESPFTSYGSSAMQILVNSMSPPTGVWADSFPVTDTSAAAVPNAIIEAVRLLTLGQIYENNNLANRGVAKTQSGQKSIAWKSTEGSSGRGVPLFYDQAVEWLKPYKFQDIL